MLHPSGKGRRVIGPCTTASWSIEGATSPQYRNRPPTEAFDVRRADSAATMTSRATALENVACQAPTRASRPIAPDDCTELPPAVRFSRTVAFSVR